VADRLVGVAVGTRDEAIAVMTQSRDPWLQSCAAYAIGELRLVAFAEVVDRWTTDADSLLRATALAARAKLKDRAAVAAVDVG
jgi:hypothetical protein